jgi:itaconate CoA-transferase
VLRRLLTDADVFLQNLAPGATARAGLSAQELHTTHPRLVVCDVSGYGLGGPYESMKAYDLMVQSESGLLSVTGTTADVAKVGVSFADIAAGMYAYSSILAALLERGRTSRGAHLDVSMLEATVEWMGFPLYYTYDGAEPPPRAGAAHATIYPYGPFTAGDGAVVMMAIQNEREWHSFCERFLGDADIATRPEFATNAQRNEHREQLEPIIASCFAAMSGDAATAALAAVPVAHARVNTMHEVWQHPQLTARQRWHALSTPNGTVPALAPPAFTSTPRMDPVPAVGQHTRAILSRLGMGDDQIRALEADGVV